MDQQEHDLLMTRYQQQLAEQAKIELANASEIISDFTAFAAGRGISLKADSFSYVQSIGVVATAPGLARTLLEPIQPDKDGLFDFKELSNAYKSAHYQAGCLCSKNHIVLAHPYYRRQMHQLANWAPRFIEVFWAFDKGNTEKYIAIDEDRVRINVDNTMYVELDTWYGAPFNQDVSLIPDGPVKLKPPSNLTSTDIEFFFASTYCLDVKWSSYKGIKTFQALELKTENIVVEANKQLYHPARYLHAEFDLANGVFRHFDGAVQLFLDDEYLLRRDSDFNFNAKSQAQIKARSKKLFKLNGVLAVPDWVELCCHFFTADPLIFEYFTGSYPEHTVKTLERIQSRV